MVFALLLAATATLPAATVPQLLESTKYVRSLDAPALRKMVPQRSGLYFVGCPNCNNGRQEEKLAWTPEHPDEAYCRFCRHRFPSAKFPMGKSFEITNPRGEKQVYRYWEDASGYRYFFEARRDDLVKDYLAGRTRELAELYSQTQEKAYADRAAFLLSRFAEVFPGWAFHYDYPFRQKEIYDKSTPASQFRPDFRTARWNWWAYKDIPNDLVQAYSLVRASGALDAAALTRVERDLLRNAGDQVLSNPESYSNMSPGMWTALIRLGRVVNEPRYIDEPVSRLKHFLDEQFFYDGVWHEGSPSYHAQTVGGLATVVKTLGDRPELMEMVDRSMATLMKMRFPDGRFVPVHDTWSFDKRAPLEESKPYLLPALGHAMLGGGTGAGQTQFHLTWSGGYGHQHADALSLLMFSKGREMLSDIGYTHTLQRAWAMSTVAHNTVVIDGTNQSLGGINAPTDGSLQWFDAANPARQTVSVDGRRAYPGLAKLYRRTLTVVDASYAVDVFEVEGGTVHDYFLHGDADASGAVETKLSLAPLASLLPGGFAWAPAPNGIDTAVSAKQHWAYGHLSALRSGEAAGVVSAVIKSGAGPSIYVTFVAEPGSQLVTGMNPAVRGAKESDSQLDKYSRPFLMLRHKAGNGRSRFVAVISNEPVEVAASGNSIKVTHQGRVESIDIRASRPAEKLELSAIEAGELVLNGRAKVLPRAGETIRMVTADGWVYPFTVVAANQADQQVRVRIAESLAFQFDSGARHLSLRAYPRREHTGAVSVDWLAR